MLILSVRKSHTISDQLTRYHLVYSLSFLFISHLSVDQAKEPGLSFMMDLSMSLDYIYGFIKLKVI